MNLKNLTRLACGFAMVAAPLFAGPVWAAPKYNPDTGHFYDLIVTAGDWSAAKADAESRSFYGLPGHLATIGSQAENDFLRDEVGIPNRSFLGGYQTDNTAEPAGNWAWVTGEPWSFTNWAPGEPNNSGGEDCNQWWTAAGQWNDISCTRVEAGYVIEYEGEGTAGIATFVVTKQYTDGRDDEVDVTLTCNSGVPLEQTFSIAGGDEVGVAFVVQDIPDGGANCEITESGGLAGYTPSMNGGDGCAWEGVTSGVYGCNIVNEADPATFTVDKEWYIENSGGQEVNQEAYVTVYCNNEIDGGWWTGSSYAYGAWLSGDDSLEVTVDTTTQSAQCSAVESIYETGVESDGDCGSRTIAAGGSSSCTFTNTVFFEGIPTLSQWGLAILALLTLGVGLIGFRRFT